MSQVKKEREALRVLVTVMYDDGSSILVDIKEPLKFDFLEESTVLEDGNLLTKTDPTVEWRYRMNAVTLNKEYPTLVSYYPADREGNSDAYRVADSPTG